VLKIEMQAGAEGKLFGSVGTVDIAEEIGKRGIEVERSEIRLADGPLRTVGDHQVELHLHADVNVEIKVVIEAAEAAGA
jgi:large subunit ribosomal protein L9